MKKIFCLLTLLLSGLAGWAQSGSVEMATGLRSSGKIYVVVAVLLVIFIGFILYLVSIDRKISRLEKKQRQQDAAD